MALVGQSFPHSILVRLFFSSEIFIEHYLRRNFAWYNSELWLEDIPHHIDTTIYVAEKDEIFNAKKVGIEIERINAKRRHETNAMISFKQWKGYGHGACVVLPKIWQEIHEHVNGKRTIQGSSKKNS